MSTASPSPSLPSLPSSVTFSAVSSDPKLNVTINKDGTLQLPNGQTYKITHLNTTIAGTSTPVPIPAELNPEQIKAIENFVNTIFSQFNESEFKQNDIHTVKISTHTSNKQAKVEKTSSDNISLGSRDVSVDTDHATTTIRQVFQTVMSSSTSTSHLTTIETKAKTIAKTALTPTPNDPAEPTGLPSAALSTNVSGIVLQAVNPDPIPRTSTGTTSVISTPKTSVTNPPTSTTSISSAASSAAIDDTISATLGVDIDADTSIDTKPGAVIKHPYTIKGKEYGTQTIVRTDNLDNARLFLDNMISHLKEKLNTKPPPSGDMKVNLEKELSLYQKELNNLKKMHHSAQEIEAFKQEIKIIKLKIKETKDVLKSAKSRKTSRELKATLRGLKHHLKSLKSQVKENKTWLDSNYFRDLLKKHENFNDAIKEYVSAPINMRQQKLKLTNGQEVNFCRLGVISDMRNGWFSLADLESIKANPANINAVIARIQSKLPGLSKIENPNHTAVEKALKKLPAKQRQSVELALSQLHALKNAPEPVRANAINKAIEDRKRVLEQQMIQVIIHQAKENPELLKQALEEGKPFDMVHVGLLNPKTSKLDETGWMHDEQIEIEDMREIFKAFRGKNLVLDGRGPLIDGDNIHLPSIPGIENKNKKVIVNPYFLNISVQGNMENEGRQLEINREELGELLLNNPKIFPGGSKASVITRQIMGLNPIPQSEAGYPIAEDLLMLLLANKKAAVSLGCLSAKDRTGIIGGRIMLRHVQPYIKAAKVNDKDLEKLEEIEFSASGPAVRVVQDNTKAKGLKVHIKANLRMKTANKVNLYAKAGAISIPGISNLYNKAAGVNNT